MQAQSMDSLRAQKTNVNHLLDEINKVCAKCKDKDTVGCDGCSHDRRKKALLTKKEGIVIAMAEK